MNGVKKILKAEKGSHAEVARKLAEPKRSVTRQNVQHWEKQGWVSAPWVLRASEVYGIPPHELNSKVFPKPAAPIAA